MITVPDCTIVELYLEKERGGTRVADESECEDERERRCVQRLTRRLLACAVTVWYVRTHERRLLHVFHLRRTNRHQLLDERILPSQHANDSDTETETISACFMAVPSPLSALPDSL